MKKTAREIAEWIDKHSDYGYYYDDRYLKGALPGGGKSLNCSDEVCPGSNRRREKMRQIAVTKLYINDDNFGEKYGRLIHQLNELLVEETMGLLDCTENEAKIWVASHIELNHVKIHKYDGEKYITIDPKVTPSDKSLKNSKKGQ